MKKQFKLSIQKPCSENWSHFIPTNNGGFCASCAKNVIDFTLMSESEIVRYFKERQSSGTCGRFTPNQLTSYSFNNTQKGRFSVRWMQAALAGLSLLFVSKQGFSQTNPFKTKTEIIQLEKTNGQKITVESPIEKHTVKGVVKDDYGNVLPGVTVYIKGSNIGTTTNMNGEFSFSEELKLNDVLVVCFIGMVTQEIKITKKSPINLDIELVLSCEIMGEVSVEGPYKTKSNGISGFMGRLKEWF